MCLYDIIWKLVDLALCILSFSSRPMEQQAPSIELVPPPKTPDPIVQFPGTGDPLYYRLLKYTLRLLTIGQAVKLIACQGIPWTHMFTTFYLVHWALAMLQPILVKRLAKQPISTGDIKLLQRLSRGIFQAAAHIVICLMMLPYVDFRSHLLLIAGPIILACASGTVEFESTEYLLFLAVPLHYLMILEVYMLAYTPSSISVRSESTSTGAVLAFNGLCFLLTLILGTARQPSRLSGYIFCTFVLLLTLFPYMQFFHSSNTYRPTWTRYLG